MDTRETLTLQTSIQAALCTRRPRLQALVAVAGVLLAPLAARAQMPDRNMLNQYFSQGVPGYGTALGTTVLSRQEPEYDPLGVRVGDFIVRPEVDESVGYNSNILGQVPAQGSLIEETSANLGITSDWKRDSLGAAFNVTNLQVPSFSNQNQTTWSAALGGSYQIGDDVATLSASHMYQFIEPYGIDVASFNRPGVLYSAPIPFQVTDVRGTYAANYGSFSLIPGFDFMNTMYGGAPVYGLNGFVPPPAVAGTVDGVPTSLGFLNHNTYEGDLTARYEYAPLRDFLAVAREQYIVYTSPNAQFGPTRNGNAIDMLVGLDYTANGVWRYQVLGGYEIRQYYNYKSHSAPVFEGNLIWQPSGVTTVSLRGLRTIDDAVDLDVAGFIYTSGRLQVDHEIRRNLLITAYTAIDHAYYLSSGGGNETFMGAGGGLTYLINRNIHLALTYDWVDHNGQNGFGPDYLQNVGMLTLKFAL
jgi:hypothetical protein